MASACVDTHSTDDAHRRTPAHRATASIRGHHPTGHGDTALSTDAPASLAAPPPHSPRDHTHHMISGAHERDWAMDSQRIATTNRTERHHSVTRAEPAVVDIGAATSPRTPSNSHHRARPCEEASGMCRSRCTAAVDDHHCPVHSADPHARDDTAPTPVPSFLSFDDPNSRRTPRAHGEVPWTGSGLQSVRVPVALKEAAEVVLMRAQQRRQLLLLLPPASGDSVDAAETQTSREEPPGAQWVSPELPARVVDAASDDETDVLPAAHPSRPLSRARVLGASVSPERSRSTGQASPPPASFALATACVRALLGSRNPLRDGDVEDIGQAGDTLRMDEAHSDDDDDDDVARQLEMVELLIRYQDRENEKLASDPGVLVEPAVDQSARIRRVQGLEWIRGGRPPTLHETRVLVETDGVMGEHVGGDVREVGIGPVVDGVHPTYTMPCPPLHWWHHGRTLRWGGGLPAAQTRATPVVQSAYADRISAALRTAQRVMDAEERHALHRRWTEADVHALRF